MMLMGVNLHLRRLYSARTEASKTLLYQLRTANRSAVDPEGRKWALFDRRSADAIPTGSLIKVSYLNAKDESRSSNFVGILLAIKQSVSEPSFLVRGLVDGVGVEQQFSVFSPLLQSVEVLKTPKFKTFHSLYGLREKPEMVQALLTSTEDCGELVNKVLHGEKPVPKVYPKGITPRTKPKVRKYL